MDRPNVSGREVDQATTAAYKKLYHRLGTKGWGSYASRHEILGILTEEYHELVEAVQSEPLEGSRHSVREELLDIAVGCIFGVACIDGGYLRDHKNPVPAEQAEQVAQ